jgi:hypothetical protein
VKEYKSERAKGVGGEISDFGSRNADLRGAMGLTLDAGRLERMKKRAKSETVEGQDLGLRS